MARERDDFDELLVPLDVEAEPLPRDLSLSPPLYFPPPTATTAEGLLCVGGRLTPERLLDAYRHGIFPWPMWENEPVAWWSPDPRAIIEFDRFHVSRRLHRTLRSGQFQATINRNFAGVIRGCATSPGRRGNTWLTRSMIAAYNQMHELGHAHSLEVWHAGRLAGGTYGMSVGGLFAAESMFYRVRDASKVALVHLVGHLHARGYQLLDIQQWTPHTGSLGAVEIPRIEYLRRLAGAIELPITFGVQRCKLAAVRVRKFKTGSDAWAVGRAQAAQVCFSDC
jgi:leucyl/phenylalanyl-tRNA--protein transferase